MMQLGKFCDCCRHLGLGFDQSKNMYNGKDRQSSVVLGGGGGGGLKERREKKGGGGDRAMGG